MAFEREIKNIRKQTCLSSTLAFDQYEGHIRMIVACLRTSDDFPNLYPHVVSGSFRLTISGIYEAHLSWSAVNRRGVLREDQERISAFVGKIGA